ncbi:MAG: hypothetical protein ACD_52C00102G0008 [uncultured bacterium]|nr:MAG: hypothetical protein ACD_52C00102G0008 [uncultured bacterium]
MTIEEVKTSFSNKLLFETAMTHRSWLNENGKSRASNERLEFLGDAILEFAVSAFLYDLLPDKEEGFLTAIRANLVNTVNLASIANKLKLGTELYLSRGEEAGGGRENTSLLADTVEALIGALYLDQGLDAARKFIKDVLLFDIDEKLSQPLKDAKSALQEAVQARGLSAPIYEVIEESGPDHNKQFTVSVLIAGEVVATGSGTSKSHAQQQAATAALVKFTNKS